MQEPDGLSENNYLTIAKANRSLCAAKEPIGTLRDFSKIKKENKRTKALFAREEHCCLHHTDHTPQGKD